MAAHLRAANPMAIGRGSNWNYDQAININEGEKIFYLYRGVLIVLVVALPHCTQFLDNLTIELLLRKTGTINEQTFDKAVWLMCHAMNWLDSEQANLNSQLTIAYTNDGGYNLANPNNRGYIKSFNDETAKQGAHTVIAKSISRIVIRFLFAFSLNLRGIADVQVPLANARIDGADGADDDAAAAIGRVTEEIDSAIRVQSQIEEELPRVMIRLQTNLSRLNDQANKDEFLKNEFDPIIQRLTSLGGKFGQKVADIQRDIDELNLQPGTAVGAPPQRISPRTFTTKLNTLQTSITRCGTDFIRELKAELDKRVQEQQNRAELSELLASAGNTFKGLQPISGLQTGTRNLNVQLVPRLLEKALVLQANISKLLVTPVSITYKPSIQEFLSVIGLLDSAAAALDDSDDDDDDGSPLLKRLRSILEPVGAQGQCDQTIGSLGKNPGIRCYICGGVPTGRFTMECEHIFCIGLAIEYFGLLRCSGLSNEEKQLLSILYAWAHRCCNRLKSNISFMKVNPNYKAPAPAAAGRNNFFMFHDDNAAKLLGEIYSNTRQHDCRDINRGSITKAQFVAAKLPVVSANVLPLVNVANTVFGTVFAASTVLFTAMSCFKKIASLLVIQATISRGQNDERLTFNRDNMIDGFQSILPGVIAAAAGGGSSRNKKNKYVGGMEPVRGDRAEQQELSYYNDIKQMVFGPITIEIEQLIQEELTYYGQRVVEEEGGSPPQSHEVLNQDMNRVNLDGHGNINVEQKYKLLFNLITITHSLNPFCLYSQLLLLFDIDRQQAIITTFQDICINYINQCLSTGQLLTLEELSVILLCQMATGDGDGDGVELREQIPINHVSNFNVLGYISNLIEKDMPKDMPDVDKIKHFFTSTNTIFMLMSRDKVMGQYVDPVRHHTGKDPTEIDKILSTFRNLCLVQFNRYEECRKKIEPLVVSSADDASAILTEFIKDDLFLWYCPFSQETFEEIEEPFQKRERVTYQPTEQNKSNLFKSDSFQTYLIENGYLDFFEHMVHYQDWTFEFSRSAYREFKPKYGNADSQIPSSQESSQERPETGTHSKKPKGQILFPVLASGSPGGAARSWWGNFGKGGKCRSKKKNKNNITKKYRTKKCKSRQTRHNKHKYKHIRTIKRRKSRRNNSN